MDLTQTLQYLEKSNALTRLTFLPLFVGLLRAEASRQSDPNAFLEALRTEALDELEAVRFSDTENPEDTEVREAARAQIAAAIELAKASPDRMKAPRPQT